MFEEILKKEEAVTLALRSLYERHGYKKYRMSRFEEYDLYLDNKNFMSTRNIITFNDPEGRVLALKPDVTLSIVKNTRATSRSSEKLYYLENVFRFQPAARAYREIAQLGLECFGRLDNFQLGETISLAAETLKTISSRSVLTLSHAGFVLKMLEGLGVDAGSRARLLENIRLKRAHEIRGHGADFGITDAVSDMLAGIAELDGAFRPTLRRARGMAIVPTMSEALDQLEDICSLLENAGYGDMIRLDFSLIIDAEYYSGLMFEGFVESIPRPVLTGGYYGGLMKKFGRDLDAIGFAVYLDELNLLYADAPAPQPDAILLYGDDANPLALCEAAQSLRQQGLRVRTERDLPDDADPQARIFRFEGLAVREETKC